jgi:hypothetical protein
MSPLREPGFMVPRGGIRGGMTKGTAAVALAPADERTPSEAVLECADLIDCVHLEVIDDKRRRWLALRFSI